MSFLCYASIVLKRAASFRYPSKLNCVQIGKSASYTSAVTKTIHDVNTNVAKDVILFKYENPKFYMYMNIFAVVQYMFWTYLGLFALRNLKDAPVDKSAITDDTPWYRKINLGENKYRNTLGTLAVVIGNFKHCNLIWINLQVNMIVVILLLANPANVVLPLAIQKIA